MPSSGVGSPDLLGKGLEAFEAEDWAAVVDALEAAGSLPPEASDALAKARWWLDDPRGAIAAWEAAYTGYLGRGADGDKRSASRTAVTIAREYTSALGNEAATNGWLQRAASALRDEDPCPEHGWISLAEAERTADPSASKRLAESALDVARSFGDR